MCVVKRKCVENRKRVRWIAKWCFGSFFKSLVPECCSIRRNASGPGGSIIGHYMTFIGTENIYFLTFPILGSKRVVTGVSDINLNEIRLLSINYLGLICETIVVFHDVLFEHLWCPNYH